MVPVQPVGQEIPTAMQGSPSASARAVLRQNLWQEPYAVVLQVRILCGGASGNWRPYRDQKSNLNQFGTGHIN